jgi:hypothetical protein
MGSTLASVPLRRFVVRSKEQELAVRPSALRKHSHPWPFPRAAGPTYFSLRGHCAAGAARTPKAAPEGRRAGRPESREAGKRKATPRPRPTRLPALRVRLSRSGFSDRPSLACRKPRRHPCRRPCGRIDRLPPLPRRPVEQRGLLPARAESEAAARMSARRRRKPLEATSSNLARTKPSREQAPRTARCATPRPSSDPSPTPQARLHH